MTMTGVHGIEARATPARSRRSKKLVFMVGSGNSLTLNCFSSDVHSVWTCPCGIQSHFWMRQIGAADHEPEELLQCSKVAPHNGISMPYSRLSDRPVDLTQVRSF